MSYIDGFVLAVPTANRDKYEEMCCRFDSMMIDRGALRVVEAWGDDVPHGKRTDFYRATEATADETIVFSWVEWPDKATRDTAHEWMKTSFPQDEMPTEMPFEGARMITGGFTTFLSLGAEK